MSHIAIMAPVSLLFPVPGLVGYFENRAKELRIEKSAKMRGAPLSDEERMVVEKHRKAKEYSLKVAAIGAVGGFFFLLQATANM